MAEFTFKMKLTDQRKIQKSPIHTTFQVPGGTLFSKDYNKTAVAGKLLLTLYMYCTTHYYDH